MESASIDDAERSAVLFIIFPSVWPAELAMMFNAAGEWPAFGERLVRPSKNLEFPPAPAAWDVLSNELRQNCLEIAGRFFQRQ
jgi:hypothetical protein